MHRLLTIACAAGIVVASTSGITGRAAEPMTRRAYITVVDNQGQMVPGLTAADLTLKEGGRDREITSVEPATEKMRIAILLEETLAPQGAVRQAIADFAKRMAPNAEISLVVMALSNRVAVPYTSDLNTLVAGINALPLSVRQQQTTHVSEGIYEMAREFQKDPSSREVIVAVAIDMLQASSEEPQNVLNQIKDSGALMHVVSIEGGSSTATLGQMADMSGRGQVLGDGPKQSGGRQLAVSALTAVPRAMQQIADDLSSQYVVTYVLPDGVKPSDRLAITTKKRGATLRAPSRIPNK